MLTTVIGRATIDKHLNSAVAADCSETEDLPEHQTSQGPKHVLSCLINGLKCQVYGAVEGVISSITADSRLADEGSLFVAIKGVAVDGHDFIADAIARGCRAIVCRRGCERSENNPQVTYIEVDDPHEALGVLAAQFYSFPAKEVVLAGITGTNGKTTTSYLLEGIIREAGGKPGVIGTINYRFGSVVKESNLTTPDPVYLQELLRQMVDMGATHVIMEVSSHALAQKRLYGLEFDLAVFTNLSRDHLDYHGSMAKYFACKKLLFSHYLKDSGKGIISLCRERKDDEGIGGDDWGRMLVKALEQECKSKECREIVSFSTDSEAAVSSSAFSQNFEGIKAVIRTRAGNVCLESDLIGEFNYRNILAAVGAGVALDLPLEQITRGVAAVRKIPGRLERVECKADVQVFVDYAHTPDALLNVLLTVRQLAPQRLIVVFGCGGDRDRGKRPQMGAVAAKLADCLIITSDNPRSEDPRMIMDEISRGVKPLHSKQMRAEIFLRQGWKGFYDLIESRRQAIEEAIFFARPGDVILICGKGHENYQIIGNQKKYFDDRREVERALHVIQ